MKTVVNDDYFGVCDAKGCREKSNVAISLFGVETDLHLCGKCLKKLTSALNAFNKEKK